MIMFLAPVSLKRSTTSKAKTFAVEKHVICGIYTHRFINLTDSQFNNFDPNSLSVGPYISSTLSQDLMQVN